MVAVAILWIKYFKGFSVRMTKIAIVAHLPPGKNGTGSLENVCRGQKHLKVQ